MHNSSEWTLDELLGDPLTQAIMTADRVDPMALIAMLKAKADEIATSHAISGAADRPARPTPWLGRMWSGIASSAPRPFAKRLQCCEAC